MTVRQNEHRTTGAEAAPPSGRRGSGLRVTAAAGALLVLAALLVWLVTDPGSGPAVRAAGAAEVAGIVGAGPAGEKSKGDGSIGDERRLTPFDTGHPAVDRLDPALRTALRQAATRAREDGIELRITSGWRSKAYQQRLFDGAVIKHGGTDRARQWVATPEKSAHVFGKAVDIGPTDSADWMVRKGAAFGLCQVYANEMWHFELLTTPGGECPQQRSNAAG
ncbi:M15 family metallopeptidase [Streptomyces yaizuensis]|uniref:M15 family metallopeptidase n=1 Tax=Streptomyces yaizuensis TaxID=2989713 RepID=A0ABQ5P7T4_9ACTN|nr:M15 family metallopeptidase [Streptomyces sp. YSPA8]GLF98643.1 M15 family metallopeptidase [Streptomyces sp. YSPA8]